MDTLWLVLRFVVSLAVVLGLIWGLARVKKRISPTNSGTIQVLSKIPVSRKGSLLLVEVGGKKMMIGATDNNISLLGVIDMPPETHEIKEERRPVQLDSFMVELMDSPQSVGFDPALLDKDTVTSLKHTQSDSKLAGSVLSRDTWRALTETLREKTIRS
jgi:flagellar protein FliO/FliZ